MVMDGDLTDLAAALADGTVSAQEAVSDALAGAQRWAHLNAVVATEPEEALAAARACDAGRAAGRLRGALHGVPLAHKDMFYRADRVSGCGSRIWADHVPDQTSPLVARLEGAGAITIGRLHMAEFALGPTGHNAQLGRCHNPWHEQAISGGSSSGSGAAVAAGIVRASLGSDTGGSVRLPAAFCGIAGLKPTNGLLSAEHMMPLSQTMDTAGVLARSSRDIALLMGLLTDGQVAASTVSVRDLRIGVPDSYYVDDLHPEVAAAFDTAIATFTALGATVSRVAVPDQHPYTDLAARIWPPEGATFHRERLETRPQDFGEQVRNRLLVGTRASAVDYLSALADRQAARAAMLAGPFAACDLLLTPAARMPVPFAHEVDATAGEAMQRMVAELSALTRTISMLGFPALATPMGMDARGLPLALQLVGPPLAEASLLTAARAYEGATGFILNRPSLPNGLSEGVSPWTSASSSPSATMAG
jgi:aspartyl-tRNA(Asn)/glutamyl-tRNA(Gln) amidotransferase subunit A